MVLQAVRPAASAAVFVQRQPCNYVLHKFTAASVWRNGMYGKMRFVFCQRKIVVIKCWYIHCAACIKEFPEVNNLVRKYKDRKTSFSSV
jgi:hypothetical protein